jgi:hypothetical protein
VTDRRHACQCCGFRTLTVRDEYEVCSVCFWEDDPVQNEAPQSSEGANSLSLEQARQNFIELGACQRELLNNVRPPAPNEMPIPRVLVGLERERLIQVHRQAKIHILTIIRGMLSGHISVLDGCDCIAMMAHQVDPAWDDKFRLFEGIAGETDEFPQGSARQEWEADALAQKDVELSIYGNRISDLVLSACRELEIQRRADGSEEPRDAGKKTIRVLGCAGIKNGASLCWSNTGPDWICGTIALPRHRPEAANQPAAIRNRRAGNPRSRNADLFTLDRQAYMRNLYQPQIERTTLLELAGTPKQPLTPDEIALLMLVISEGVEGKAAGDIEPDAKTLLFNATRAVRTKPGS